MGREPRAQHAHTHTHTQTRKMRKTDEMCADSQLVARLKYFCSRKTALIHSVGRHSRRLVQHRSFLRPTRLPVTPTTPNRQRIDKIVTELGATAFTILPPPCRPSPVANPTLRSSKSSSSPTLVNRPAISAALSLFAHYQNIIFNNF